jgi:hypothetical protein
MADLIETIKGWFRRSGDVVERELEGGEPVATPPGRSTGDDVERETSTNAQTSAAADEPWPGND